MNPVTFSFSPDVIFMLLVNVALVAAAWGSLRARVNQLTDKSKGQDGLELSLTELRVEMKHLREAVDKQPAVIAQVVAVSIREVLRLVGPQQQPAGR